MSIVVSELLLTGIDIVSGMHIVELQRKLMEARNEIDQQSKYRVRTAAVEEEKERQKQTRERDVISLLIDG